MSTLLSKDTEQEILGTLIRDLKNRLEEVLDKVLTRKDLKSVTLKSSLQHYGFNKNNEIEYISFHLAYFCTCGSEAYGSSEFIDYDTDHITEGNDVVINYVLEELFEYAKIFLEKFPQISVTLNKR